MKLFISVFLIFISINISFSQIKEFGDVELFKYKSEKDFDYVLIGINPQIYKIEKNILKSNYLPGVNVKFEKRDFAQSDFLEIIIPYDQKRIKHISSIEKCEAFIEKKSSKKMDMSQINEAFQLVKSDSIMDWGSQGNCVYNSNRIYRILKKNNFTTLKAIALPKYKLCYTDNSSNIPKWTNHIANAIHCTDGNYFVLDLFIDTDRPLLYSEWKERLSSDLNNCENFELYMGNTMIFPTYSKETQKVYFAAFNTDCPNPIQKKKPRK